MFWTHIYNYYTVHKPDMCVLFSHFYGNSYTKKVLDIS